MKIKQGKMRILLACADESLLKQTKRRMQASNELELVGCTSNGTKAWEMIRQKTPDMVVLHYPAQLVHRRSDLCGVQPAAH